MRCRARDLCLFLLGCGLLFSVSPLSGGETPSPVSVSADGARVELSAPADETTLVVRPLVKGQAGPALMGRVEKQGADVVFVPAAPLLPGQSYRLQWRSPTGEERQTDFSTKTIRQVAPRVGLAPKTKLPANALKVYLHFTEPMEQGVFLDRLRLMDSQGQEVLGPFRETELWSPDGKRLTVWFHPGRQKAGVNLNVDEGPVLRPGGRYSLIVSGSWRSTAGVAIGNDPSFEWETTEADHECPQMERWKLQAPNAGSKEPLKVHFDEGLDPAMLTSALRVRQMGVDAALEGRVEVSPSAKQWSFYPVTSWEGGDYELHADPNLEDLAGNNLEKPFEVAVGAAAREAAVTVRVFSVSGGPSR